MRVFLINLFQVGFLLLMLTVVLLMIAPKMLRFIWREWRKQPLFVVR